MARIIHLDEHVSRVQSSVLELLDSPNCNLLLLSDVQVAVLEQMTFPYVRWATRLIEDHEHYQVLVEMPQAYKDELECLELLLSGGSTMTCDLSAVLAALATAIANQPSGAGACNYSGSSAILNCLPGMMPEELIPQIPTEPPEYGVPPAGFDTWAEYLTHKCKAAWAVYDTVYGLFGALSGLPILQLSVTVIGTALGGYIAATAFGAVAFPPAAIIAIAAAALAIGLLDAQAYIQFRAIQSYLEAHKSEIVCALYQSGSASEALAGLADEIEDAVQSVEWSVIFGGVIGPQLASAVGAMAAEAQTNNLVNPLFQVMEDFAYPDVSCCGEEPPSGPDWHFDADAEGWIFSIIKNEGDSVTGAWGDGAGNPDPGDPSAGQLTCQIQETSPPLGNVYGIWTYYFPFGQVPEVVAGDELSADLYCSLQTNAGYTLKITYKDATYSQNQWQNPSGWVERSVVAIEGKLVDNLQVIFSLGETTDYHNYAADNVRWGQ